MIMTNGQFSIFFLRFIELLGSSCTCSLHTCGNRETPYTSIGWIGHPLDPIGVLFDTLCEACLVADDVSQGKSQVDSNSSEK